MKKEKKINEELLISTETPFIEKIKMLFYILS